MEDYARLGLAVNVDFYAGMAYRILGLENDLAVSIFLAARMAGLGAHIIEQAENNILIRPLLKSRL
jgi:citrate synthase